MNPGVSQCKNCWKWEHSTFLCRIQGFKYIKCNGPHKSENHCEFSWCCKANAKTNPHILKLKKASHAHTHSNALTVRMNIKQTQTHVRFGGTDLIENGTKRNTLRFMKIGPNQFVQP